MKDIFLITAYASLFIGLLSWRKNTPSYETYGEEFKSLWNYAPLWRWLLMWAIFLGLASKISA